MTHHSIKHHAAASAALCVRNCAVSLLVCGTLAAGVAHADGPGEPPDQHAQPRRDEGRALPPGRESLRGQLQQGGDARLPDPRGFDARLEEQRRAMQDNSRNAEMGRRARLTPDERRDLRRQINEVGQDIYSTPPRR